MHIVCWRVSGIHFQDEAARDIELDYDCGKGMKIQKM